LPSLARRQHGRLRRVRSSRARLVLACLHPFSPPDPWAAGLRRGLRDLGYVEGQNITIDERGAEDHDERLDGLAKRAKP
jgi:hypothetical protein